MGLIDPFVLFQSTGSKNVEKQAIPKYNKTYKIIRF